MSLEAPALKLAEARGMSPAPMNPELDPLAEAVREMYGACDGLIALAEKRHQEEIAGKLRVGKCLLVDILLALRSGD